MIDKRLNLVIPVDRSDGTTLWVHSTPISREVFQDNFEPLTRAWSRLIAGGVDFMSAARVANLMLRKVGKEMAEDGLDQVEKVLWPEIVRLTVVLVPGEKGYEPVPFEVARKQELLDGDDVSEVENALAFFTFVSYLLRKKVHKQAFEVMKLWGAETTSSNISEYANSLRTSKTAGSSGETQVMS